MIAFSELYPFIIHSVEFPELRFLSNLSMKGEIGGLRGEY